MTNVFANGREVSGKSTPNKTIAAFPDVCLSPPSPPAGPIPIPYPNFGMASDTTSGCTSVIVKGKEAGKKNASKYSTIKGDEPATNSFGAGVVSHKINGPLYFAAYSFDVMFEGSGAERFMDLTTTNHMNNQNTNAPTPNAAPPSASAPAQPPDCASMRAELNADRAAVQQNIDAGTPAFGSQSLATNVQSGTLASATTTPGGGMQYGASNQLLADRAQRVSGRGYPGPNAGPGYNAYGPTPSQACAGNPPIVHPTGRHSRHAEMKILNKIDWANNPPSTITFCISYPASGPNGGQPDCPCPTCQNTINQVCACVEQIYVCDDTNTPQPQCP